MDDKRQKNQLVLAFMEEGRSEAPMASVEGTESSGGERGTESPAITEHLIEDFCGRDNWKQEWIRVKAHQRCAGVDGKTDQQMPEFL